MAVAGDRHGGCDGCGQTVPLEELTAVTMPDGERVACCPRCEPHAREAARKCSSLDQRRDTCDGCTDTYLESQLEDVVLDDGTVVACCPSCVAEVPGRGSGADRRVSASNDTPSDAGVERTTGTDDATDEESLCTQCNEWIATERFPITTIDGRSERLCPACKDSAEQDGIIKDVGMRRAEAREVLRVERGATADEIRSAFHREVKRAHPDRKSGSASAFQLVTDAYERLAEDDYSNN